MILNKQQSKVPSEHFDFKDWEQAFDYYYKQINEHGPDAVQFVCAEHPYTSGYWVEPAGCLLSVGDTIVYPEKIEELREKIKSEIKTASEEGRRPKFVTI